MTPFGIATSKNNLCLGAIQVKTLGRKSVPHPGGPQGGGTVGFPPRTGESRSQVLAIKSIFT